MSKKTLRLLILGLVFVFPLFYIPGFAFPTLFPHIALAFFVIELLLFIFIFRALKRGSLTIPKNNLIIGIGVYILILAITMFAGVSIGQSFWSNHSRMMGFVTWLHYFGLLIVMSAVFTSRSKWKIFFRTLLFSTMFLALVSFLGKDGLDLAFLSGIKQGGSLLGNNTFSSLYYVLAFFMSCIGLTIEDKKIWKIVYIAGLLMIGLNPDLFNFKIFTGDISVIEAFKNPTLFAGTGIASSFVLWGGGLCFAFLAAVHKFVARKKVVIAASLLLTVLFGLYTYGFISMLSQKGSVFEVYSEISTLARPIVWGIAIDGIKEKPVFGYGLENFQYVYQRHFDPEVMTIENRYWFERPHNFTLEHMINTGAVGTLTLLAVFMMLTMLSFKLYSSRGRFYFILIPFIFFLHFVQMQTSFQTDSSLFLSFLLLAFLVSHTDKSTYSIPKYLQTDWSKSGLVVISLVCASFFVFVPTYQNRLIDRVAKAESTTARIEIYEEMKHLRVSPERALRSVSTEFMNAVDVQREQIFANNYEDAVRGEWEELIALYERYESRFENNYRFLFDYAVLLTNAHGFGLDYLEKGEEVIRRAQEVSAPHPHSFWVLAINAYYQGDNEQALAYAKEARQLNPEIELSEQVYAFVEHNTGKNDAGEIFHFSFNN